ncbi:MAG: antibiotic biosynthesis monooxygenase [Alphaproteobacteria bacterium]|nr:MAG: antibiotic biosynthesis monooxygenase [Alphaproteobacteria bacterium]
MILRLWHGWTDPEKADAYEKLLLGEVIPGIMEKRVEGFRHIEVLRRDDGDEVVFVTLMWFDSLDAVRAFAGEDYARAYVPAAAQALLKRFAGQSAHYEVRADFPAAGD